MSKGSRQRTFRVAIRVYFSEQEHADVMHTAASMGISPGQWLRAIGIRNTEWSIMQSVDEHLEGSRDLPPDPAPEPAPEPEEEPEPCAPPAPAAEAGPESPFGRAVPDPVRSGPPEVYAVAWPVDRTPIERPSSPDAELATEPRQLDVVYQMRLRSRLRQEVRGTASDRPDWLRDGRTPTGPQHVGFHHGDKQRGRQPPSD